MRALLIVAVFVPVAAAQAAPPAAVWQFMKKQSTTQLLVGPKDSEEADGMFSCEKGKGPVRLSFSVTYQAGKPVASVKGKISIGKATFEIPGRLETNDLTGGLDFTAAIPAQHPVFDALPKARSMTIAAGTLKMVYPYSGLTSGTMQKFLTTCGR